MVVGGKCYTFNMFNFEKRSLKRRISPWHFLEGLQNRISRELFTIKASTRVIARNNAKYSIFNLKKRKAKIAALDANTPSAISTKVLESV